MQPKMNPTADLILRLAANLEGLAMALEAVSGPGPIVDHARKAVEEARNDPIARLPFFPASPAPAASPPPVSELTRLVREYFTTDSFPRRGLVQYEIQEMLGLGDPKEREERRPKLEKECALVDASKARGAARRTGV